MSTFAKTFCWFSVVNGAVTIATPILLALWGNAVPPQIIAIWCTLGLIGTAGGVLALKGKAWAFWLLAVGWLVQTAEYFSESAIFSFVGPLALRVGWGYNSPPSQFNLNLLAICFAVVSVILATSARRRANEVSSAA